MISDELHECPLTEAEEDITHSFAVGITMRKPTPEAQLYNELIVAFVPDILTIPVSPAQSIADANTKKNE